MTVAVSRAKGRGAEAVICASTGNTAASAAAYAARAGMRGAVIVPEGKIAIGKLAQALMHGARVVALQGNFDDALRIVRELAEKHPIELVNSVNPHRIEGQKTAAFEVIEELGEAPGALAIPVGNAGNVTAYWRGFQEAGAAPVLYGFQAEGAAPLVARRAGRQPRDRRLGDPDRQPGPLGGGDGRLHRLARPGRRGLRRADPRRLPLARRQRGRLLRAGLGGLGGRACSPTACPSVEGAARPSRSSASSPATASRTPTRRSPKRRSVINCENDLSAVERAVFDVTSPPPTRPRPRLLGQPRPRLRRAGGGGRAAPGAGGRGGGRVLASTPAALDVPTGRDNLVVRAFESLHPADGIAFRLRSEIPLARGLGSSAAAIVAGLFAADHLFELALSKEEMLARATELEGHPDNVAAAIYGGFVDLRRRARATPDRRPLRPARRARGRSP